MSDATEAPSGTAAPETTKTEPEKTPNVGEPEWLPKRLEQAKRSAEAAALQALGVDSLDAAKAAIAKAKELEESKKSEIEKFAEKVKNLEPEAKKAADLAARLNKYADAELSKLTEEQKTAVLAIAGDDKGKALDAIEALRPTWTKKADEPGEQAKKPLPQPAKTTASGAAPASGNTATVDHKAIYEALKKEHPMKAAQYALQHAHEIYK